MGDKLHLAMGVMGNATSLLLYTVPILTFARVIKKKSTEEFSCVPYIISLFNCLLYTWYGLPVVSNRWENFTVVSTNGSPCCYIKIVHTCIYIYTFRCRLILILMFENHGVQKKAAMILTPGIVVICITIVISAFVFHDHRHRKIFTGSVGLLVAAAMYGSPLVVMKQVIATKSVEFMPFYLSLFSFLASSFWLAYGLVSHELFLAAPNLLGSPLGFLQLVIYFKYRKWGVVGEPEKVDLEKDGEKSKQLQPVINDSTGGKS
ncbi:bidirectional sugar transporter sweet3 [Quercus suber]|uniref:Bidirectional sugar transporter SWEET n=1 Tax=Quercus suber TaxID=58331 RepID=A0AAW0KL89_QUESU